MSDPTRPDELLWRRSLRVAEQGAQRRAERNRHAAGVAAGDLFLLGEGDDLLEWVVLRVDGAKGRALAAPADTHPLVGGSDVSVDVAGPSGPLTVRCALASWIDLGRMELPRRSGYVEPDAVERALASWERIQAGGASAALTDTDLDPEYRELMDEIRPRARSVQERAGIVTAPAESRPAARATRPAWAALFGRGVPALFPALSLALIVAVVWQVRQNATLRDQARRLESDRARPDPTVPPERAAAQPLVNVPVAWLTPQETTRGPAAETTVAPAAGYFLLVLEVQDRVPAAEYRLEVRKDGTGDPMLALPGLRRGAGGLVTIALPRATLPPGSYRLVLKRSAEARVVHQYALRTAAPAAATSSPP